MRTEALRLKQEDWNRRTETGGLKQQDWNRKTEPGRLNGHCPQPPNMEKKRFDKVTGIRILGYV